MKKIISLAFVACTVLPTYSLAQENSYVQISYGVNTIKDETGTIGSYDNSSIAITLGKEISNNIAVEGVLGSGVGDDSNTVQGRRVTVKTKEFFGLYLRPFVKLNDQFELFGRAGYFRTKIHAAIQGGATVSDSDGDVSYGLGAALSLSKTSAIVLDFTHYYDKDDTQVRGFGISYRHRF
jgi:hypothetical protein